MAPPTAELATLRALTFRISSTSTSQLPQHVPAIAASLANCRHLLSSSQTTGPKASSEASVAVHKYRTLLSTLLQDRTIHGRWSAIVLIKATIEAGGWETLHKSLPWVRGLLGILSKPDPPSSKKLCLITLTRIFLLTRDYPTLIREITTPSLAPFIQASLQLASSRVSPSLLHAIIECFNELIPRHPTVFRTYMKQLQQLLGQILGPTPSSKLSPEQVNGPKLEVTSEVSAAARRLYVQLPSCAPKGGSSEEWEASFKATVTSVHQTADRVFRAVVEDWQSTIRELPATNGQTLEDEVQDLQPEFASLTPWSGIYAGGERFVHLLRLVKAYFENPTAGAVNLNIALVVDLLTRILSLTVPSSGGGTNLQNTIRFNNQVSKEERENLWLILPGIHVAAIELLLSLAQRCEQNTALDSLFLDQLTWIFSAEKEAAEIRTAIYLAASTLLERSGLSLPKSSIDALGGLIRACCDDVLPPELSGLAVKPKANPTKMNGISQPQATTNADTFLNSSTSKDPLANFVGLKQAARDLLPLLLANIRAQYLSDAIRARMDRTAVLTQHKDAMIASVLNPPPSKKFGKPAASILPLMARSFPAAKDVEGMLRPRMPVIRLGTQDIDGDGDVEDEEEEEGEGVSEEEKEEDDHFVGQELDNLLESAGHAEEERELVMSDVPPADTAHYEKLPSSKPIHQAGTINVGEPIVDPMPSTSSTKRPQDDTTPISPTKRVKIVEEEESIPETTEPTTAQPQPNPFITSTTPFVPATSQFTATTTASIVPELPGPGDETDDSDDEDVVPLVFGQDTDEDSE